jgi:hypothetical protein
MFGVKVDQGAVIHKARELLELARYHGNSKEDVLEQLVAGL